jgi:mRNA-degrading endonuclease toxin of MazEF toxin-antitoxin module
MAEVARGGIVVLVPRPDKKRPVVVLTRQDMIGRLHTVTVAPITSTIRGVVGAESGL